MEDLWRENQSLRAQIDSLQRSAITWDFFARPWVILTLSLAAAGAFAAYVFMSIPIDQRRFFFLYLVPIAVPFTAFLLDRVARLPNTPAGQWAIDVPVLALSLARGVYSIPLISGHALFLTYALLTTRSWVARFAAAVVLGEVAYLKLFVWHDLTFFGGLLLGAMTALILRLIRQPQAK